MNQRGFDLKYLVKFAHGMDPHRFYCYSGLI